MKRITVLIMTVLFTLSFTPGFATVDSTLTTESTTPVNDNAASEVLISRLKEIKEMDRTNMNSSEKKVLRNEVKSIRNQLREYRGGIYISFGAVIIIGIIG